MRLNGSPQSSNQSSTLLSLSSSSSSSLSRVPFVLGVIDGVVRAVAKRAPPPPRSCSPRSQALSPSSSCELVAARVASPVVSFGTSPLRAGHALLGPLQVSDRRPCSARLPLSYARRCLLWRRALYSLLLKSCPALCLHCQFFKC